MANAPTASSPKLSGLKYLVESILSTDDTGTVTLISDQNAFGRRYALKIIKRDGPESDRWIALAKASREASALLGHPAILAYHDFRTQRKWFQVNRAELLMEYVQGRSLDKLENLGVDHLTLIFRQMASAMAHMHRRGVQYGDLRPQHVLLARNGAVKVFGYGVSKLPPEILNDYLPVSKRYRAPEQFKQNVVDNKTDLCSLGALMYHLMTGKSANVGARAKGDPEKIPTPISLNSEIPTSVSNLLVACLQRQPEKRPESAYEVSQKLDKIVEEKHLDDESLKGLATPAAE